MKKLVLGVAALVAMASSALAADLAPRPYTKAPAVVAAVYNWTGFYVGGNVGGAWQQADSTYTGVQNLFATGLFDAAIAVGALPRNTSQSASGVTGGLSAGYNFQSGTFVYGVEADASYLGLRPDKAAGDVHREG